MTSRRPGEAEKISNSETLLAEFNASGEISRAVQEGNFRYREGQSPKHETAGQAGGGFSAGPGGRTATAQRANYSATDDSLTLQGSPRIVDGG